MSNDQYTSLTNKLLDENTTLVHQQVALKRTRKNTLDVDDYVALTKQIAETGAYLTGVRRRLVRLTRHA